MHRINIGEKKNTLLLISVVNLFYKLIYFTIMKQRHFWLSLAFSFIGIPAMFAQTSKSVTFEITNIPVIKGKVLLSIIPVIQGKVLLSIEKGLYYGMKDVTSSTVEMKLDSVPNGKYTVYVFHDTNNNWQLDKEGEIPTEYCAIEQIEVQEDNRKFSIGLVDIRKQIQDKRK